MLVIYITILLQIVIAVTSIYKFVCIKKISDKYLYYHEKKSFQDIYKMNSIYLWFYIVVAYVGAVLSNILKLPDLVVTAYEMYWIFCVWLLVTVMLGVMVAISLYMITEIKHLSPDDGIGMDIVRIEDIKVRNAAKKFYLSESIMGFLISITLIIQAFYIHIIVGIEYILISAFFFYFGMADILQHDNYNAAEYKSEHKRMSLSEKLFISNIIYFIRDKEYHDKSIKNLQENSSNIKKGIKCIFKENNKKIMND